MWLNGRVCVENTGDHGLNCQHSKKMREQISPYLLHCCFGKGSFYDTVSLPGASCEAQAGTVDGSPVLGWGFYGNGDAFLDFNECLYFRHKETCCKSGSRRGCSTDCYFSGGLTTHMYLLIPDGEARTDQRDYPTTPAGSH